MSPCKSKKAKDRSSASGIDGRGKEVAERGEEDVGEALVDSSVRLSPTKRLSWNEIQTTVENSP